MSQATFEGFPTFVQVVLPAPATDVIQRGLRLAWDTFADEQAQIEDKIVDLTEEQQGDEVGNLRIQLAEIAKVMSQLDMLAEFFDDVADNPQSYPVTGRMAGSIKQRQRAWRAMQPKRPRRKKGQSRRAYEARMHRWANNQAERAKAYNEAANALIAAALPVTQETVDAIVSGEATVDDIAARVAEHQAEQERQREQYERVMAALAAEDERLAAETDEPEALFSDGVSMSAEESILADERERGASRLILPPGYEGPES